MIRFLKFTTVAAGVALLMVSTASAQVYESVLNEIFSPVPAEQEFFRQAPGFQQANNAFYQDQDEPIVRGQILYGGPLLPGYGGGLMSDFFANGYFIFAGDAWETRIDDDYANNFGFRVGWNQSFPVFRAIRGQFGVSYGVYDLSGRDSGGGISALVAIGRNTTARSRSVSISGATLPTATTSVGAWSMTDSLRITSARKPSR